MRKYEREIKTLRSELSDSKKQSTKALKKSETLEREIRQIRALLDGGSGASLKSRLSSAGEGDVRQQVTLCVFVYRPVGTYYYSNVIFIYDGREAHCLGGYTAS